jgi:hypothetical protein
MPVDEMVIVGGPVGTVGLGAGAATGGGVGAVGTAAGEPPPHAAAVVKTMKRQQPSTLKRQL